METINPNIKRRVKKFYLIFIFLRKQYFTGEYSKSAKVMQICSECIGVRRHSNSYHKPRTVLRTSQTTLRTLFFFLSIINILLHFFLNTLK